MNMKRIWNLYLILLVLQGGISGCTDNSLDESRTVTSFRTISLILPAELTVNVSTRAVTENTVNEVLAVLISDGQLKSEFCTVINNIAQGVSITLNTITPKKGDELYLFANTGKSSISATTKAELLNEIICSNNSALIPMSGSISISDAPTVTVEMKRAYSKVSVNMTDPTNNILNWKICHVPSQGFVTEQTGYPSGVDFTSEVISDGGIAYFIPRTDNSTTNQNKTFLLVELKDLGWYRLDFYENGTVNMAASPVLMDLERNIYYQFNIRSVSSKGYAEADEAAANTGSNILYDMEIVSQNIATNGQYSLILSKKDIYLYPIGGTSSTSVDAITVSAAIPPLSENSISTYYVRIISPSDAVKIDGDDDGDGIVDLIQAGTKLDTNNSSRNIKLLFEGADVAGTYLELHLGNIVKTVPINVLSANSYLFNFGEGYTLYIPLKQANMDKMRIQRTDDVVPVIVWSDQPNHGDLNLNFSKDKQWITVDCDHNFTGNVVIAATVNSEIRWSWHIWALDNSVISYNAVDGLYEFNLTNDYNGYTWMDRNLGALSITPGDATNQGLLYQWGRKDPFPNSDLTDAASEPTLYVGTGNYLMTGQYPPTGEDCIATNVSTNNLDYSIKNPMKFIKGMVYATVSGKPSTAQYDWFTNDYSLRRSDLWESSSGEKAQYDPCPIGWKVPNGGKGSPWPGLALSNAIVDTNGMLWTDAGYYPVASYRNLGSGLLVTPADRSSLYWWSNTNAELIAGTAITTSQIMYRRASQNSEGLLVRCVKE